MITGFYERNGVITEVQIENAPVKRELQVFTFSKRKRRPRRRVDCLSKGNVAMLSIAGGGTLGGLVLAIMQLDKEPILQWIIGAVIVLDLVMFCTNLAMWRE